METPKDDCENVSSSLMNSLKISEDGTRKIEAKLRSAVGNAQMSKSLSINWQNVFCKKCLECNEFLFEINVFYKLQ